MGFWSLAMALLFLIALVLHRLPTKEFNDPMLWETTLVLCCTLGICTAILGALGGIDPFLSAADGLILAAFAFCGVGVAAGVSETLAFMRARMVEKSAELSSDA